MTHEYGRLSDDEGAPLLRIWETRVSPGIRPLDRHSHISFEIAVVREGGGVYTVGAREYQILPGAVFVFSSNEQHYVTEIGPAGLCIVNLHFEPRYLWGRRQDRLSDRHANFCFAHGPHFENRIPPEKAASLRGAVLRMAEELAEKREEYALQVKGILDGVLVELIRSHGYADGAAPEDGGRQRFLRDCVRYIDAHFAEKLTLAVLAQRAGMSPNYFSAAFHAACGMTLWDYIQARRVEAAMGLLRGDTARNILDVAISCGFNNTANFNKVFRKKTGMTPGEYRARRDAWL